MSSSPEGRRVLVAVVTGHIGKVIQDWREIYDPQQARRLPPHATLCYWAPPLDQEGALDRQIRHAFPAPVSVTLGKVREFGNRDRTLYVDVQDTDHLSDARQRLYDATHLPMPGDSEFTWHVTCVRYPDPQQRHLLHTAADALAERVSEQPTWLVDTIAWLELRNGVYEPIRTWKLA